MIRVEQCLSGGIELTQLATQLASSDGELVGGGERKRGEGRGGEGREREARGG
jgi:hypothetical protein